MFGLSKRSRSGEEWRTKLIERRRTGHLLPIPDLGALADAIVDRSGVSGVECDSVEGAMIRARVEGVIMQRVEELGVERLARHVSASAAAGMELLKERDDFHPDMLFNYLSMHDINGIVIHNKIVEYLTNEQFVIDFAEVVQETEGLTS